MDIAHLIATRPTQRRHLATWYSELLDAAEQEGLSVAELADRVGVVKETIYAWRRRCVAASPIEHEGKRAPALVRVRVVDQERPLTSRPSLELRLQGSRRILVPEGFDVDTLCPFGKPAQLAPATSHRFPAVPDDRPRDAR